MCNLDIRAEISTRGLYHYAVAEELGVSETTFCRMLRKELPANRKNEIFAAIERLKDGRRSNA